MAAFLEKRDGESNLDFHRRLLTAKLADRSTDLSFSVLSTYLYGKRYSEDVARRMAYGSYRTLRLLDDEKAKNAVDRTAVEEIERQQVELAKERQRFYDQRREYKRLTSSDGRLEHLYDTLERAAVSLSETIGSVYDHEERVFNTDESTEAVLVLSDWHYGMVCNNVFNVYNTDVCVERIVEITEAAVKRLTLHRVSKLHIVVLGDLIHGAIHASARVASEELVCEQLMHVSELLAQTIERLRDAVPCVDVHITYGNHARTVPDKKDNIHKDNMERIVPWWLEQRLGRYNGIHIMPDTGSEFLFVNACGHDICATHGDLDSVRTSTRLLPLLFQKQSNLNIEYILVGDKHHRESFNELGVTAMICGSLCGADDYANDKRLFSKPEQLLLIVNKDDGVDAEYHLGCTY